CSWARSRTSRLRDHPPPARAGERPAARPQRLQRSRSRRGRAGRRPRCDQPAAARTTSDQRSAPVARPAPRPDPAARQPPEVTMPADPLDKQLVEAVLSRPRRAKADLEEAKMAGLRPARPKPGVAVAGDDDEDNDDD